MAVYSVVYTSQFNSLLLCIFKKKTYRRKNKVLLSIQMRCVNSMCFVPCVNVECFGLRNLLYFLTKFFKFQFQLEKKATNHVYRLYSLYKNTKPSKNLNFPWFFFYFRAFSVLHGLFQWIFHEEAQITSNSHT